MGGAAPRGPKPGASVGGLGEGDPPGAAPKTQGQAVVNPAALDNPRPPDGSGPSPPCPVSRADRYIAKASAIRLIDPLHGNAAGGWAVDYPCLATRSRHRRRTCSTCHLVRPRRYAIPHCDCPSFLRAHLFGRNLRVVSRRSWCLRSSIARTSPLANVCASRRGTVLRASSRNPSLHS